MLLSRNFTLETYPPPATPIFSWEPCLRSRCLVVVVQESCCGWFRMFQQELRRTLTISLSSRIRVSSSPQRGTPDTCTPSRICSNRFSLLCTHTDYCWVPRLFFLLPLTESWVLSTLSDNHLPSVNETALLMHLAINSSSFFAMTLQCWFLSEYLIIPRSFYAVLLRDNYFLFLYICFFS